MNECGNYYCMDNDIVNNVCLCTPKIKVIKTIGGPVWLNGGSPMLECENFKKRDQ